MKGFRSIAALAALFLALPGCGPKRIVLSDGLEVRSKAGIQQKQEAVEARLVKGRIAFVHRNSAGEILRSFETPNLVVNAGMAGIASRINGAGAEAAFTFIAIGTGVTAAAAGDTALQTEISTGGGARASCTASRVTTDVTNDTAQCVLTYNFTSSFAVTESGYFNATAAGVMVSRQTFAAINVANGDSLQTTWKLDVD